MSLNFPIMKFRCKMDLTTTEHKIANTSKTQEVMKTQSKLTVTLTLAMLIMALSACNAEPPSNLFATSSPTRTRTPIFTATYTSTVTPSLTPTSIFTFTPVPTPTSFGGGPGKIAYTSCVGSEFTGPSDFVGCEIYVMNADGSNPTQLTNDNTWDCCAAWSPDGAKIAFVSFISTGSEISVMNADGSNPIRLTNNKVHDLSPTWSPDGAKIAFASNRDGQSEIYLMDTDGSNPTRLTNTQDNYDPVWSPDGTKIAYRRDSQSDGGIYIMNADGSSPSGLNDSIFWGASLAWSPDGKKIAFETSFGTNIDIYVINADGSELNRLTDDPANDSSPAWSPDGTLIGFSSDRDGLPNIYVMNSDDSGLTRLTQTNSSLSVSGWLNQTQLPLIQHPDCASSWARLEAGNQAKVSQESITPNRVRSGPSQADEVIVLLYPGAVVKVIEGPICADGLVFWKVENASIPGGVGWTAEGDGKEYWLEPYKP